MVIVPTVKTVPPYPKTRATNCKNCGAVLKGATCEYCGTEYQRVADGPGRLIIKGPVKSDKMSNAKKKALMQELERLKEDPAAIVLIPKDCEIVRVE